MVKFFVVVLSLLVSAVLSAPVATVLGPTACDIATTSSLSATVPSGTTTVSVDQNSTGHNFYSPPSSSSPGSKGHKNILYFAEWSVYHNGSMKLHEIPGDQVTHLLYAFAGIAPDGSVIPFDKNADVGSHLPAGSETTTVYGAVEQVYRLKKKNRHMKTLLSIGGYSASAEGKFKPATSTTEGRRRFASSAVELLADWGFDGLDIDWEYPANSKEANEYVLLLKECREALDNYAKENGQDYHYLLTVAVSAGADHYNVQDFKGMDEYLDSWHLMAYDYAGGWDKESGSQSNVYPDPGNLKSTKSNTNQAVEDYMKAGISPGKIVLGVPLYGRAFQNTEGLGEPFEGVGSGSREQGIWSYRDLPRPGSTVRVDDKIISAYSYDPNTKELISFDNVETVNLKAKYLMEKGLGGALFWEASGDKLGEKSLVRAMANAMGNLDDSMNMLDYPNSRYVNIKDGMPDM